MTATVNPMPSWRRRLLPACSAFLLWLAFPPVDAFPIAFVALVPFLIYCASADTLRGRLLAAWVGGAVFHLGGFLWLRHVTVAGMILLAFYSALYWSAWAVLASAWQGRVTASFWPFRLAAAWTAIEAVRTRFLSGIPWLLLGHTQIGFPSLAQTADLAGVAGLTFLVVLVNAALAQAIIGVEAGTTAARRRISLAAWAAAGLVVAGTAYGAWRQADVDRSTRSGPDVLLVQGNIEQSVKKADLHWREIYDVYANLTRQACERDGAPEIILWPETMHPPLDAGRVRVGAFGPFDRRLLAGSNALLGVLLVEPTPEGFGGREWNSAVAVDREGRVSGRYDKTHLVPVGEYFPFRDWWLWTYLVRRFTRLARVPGLEPGETVEPVTIGSWRLGVLICYESAFAGIARDEVRRGAEILVNLSNEAWYLDSAEMDQMLALSAFRCIETRTGMARATNSGISAIIDPRGRIAGVVTDRDGRRKEVAGTLRGRVPVGPRDGLFVAWGDWFAAATALAILADLAGRFLRRELEKK